MAKMKTYTYWISYELPDEDGSDLCLWHGEPEDYGVRKKTRRELKKEIDMLSSEGSVYSRPRKVTHRYWDIIQLVTDVYSGGLGEPWHDVEWKLRGLWKKGFKTSELAGKV
jgi:hypothetical protein